MIEKQKAEEKGYNGNVNSKSKQMLRDRSVELATSPSSPKKTASKLVEGPFINFGIFPEQIIET